MRPDNQKNSDIKEKQDRLAGLYEEYYDRIARYVYVRIGNRSEAEDIAGEVFLKALDSLKSYRDEGVPMQAWLFRIAHNMVVDYFRKMGNKRLVPIDTVTVQDDSDPVKTAETNIEFERVKKAMEHLTEEQKEVINLRFFSGFTSKEAGAVMDKSDGAVREMQRAAMEKLRGILGVEL